MTHDERKMLADDLRVTLNGLARCTDDVTINEYHPQAFGTADPYFVEWQVAKRAAQMALTMDFNQVGFQDLNVLSGASRRLVALVDTMKKIVSSDERYEDGPRKPVNDDLVPAVSDFCRAVSVLLAINSAEPLKRFKQAEVEFKSKVDKLEKQADDNIKEMSHTLGVIRQAAVEVGATKEAKHFQDEANGHWSASMIWLSVSGFMAVVLLAGLYYFYNHPAELAYNPAVQNDIQLKSQMLVAGQRLVTKLVALSILSGFLVFTVRNYGTSRHNYIVNQHRAKALETFTAFVAGTNTKEIKDQVLVQAAKAIFSTPSSGYLRKDVTVPFGGPIVEMVNAVKSKD